MQFLVTGEWVETGALIPPDQMAGIIENVVLTSLQMLEEWVKEGRATGGVFAGEKAGCFVLDAESPEELGQLLAQLPFYGPMKWSVKALQSFASCVERDRSSLENMRAMSGGSPK